MTHMAIELMESHNPLCSNPASPACLRANLQEEAGGGLSIVKAIMKLRSFLKASAAKHRTLSPEDRLIRSLAEKHSTIFMT
jgi:hypothetical protein